MLQSPTINEIAKALSGFQGEVENAAKSATNPFFKSKYADLGTILNVARPLLGKYGLALAQFPSYEGDHTGGKVLVESLLSHTSGQWFSCVTSAPVFPTTGHSGKTEPVSAQTIGSAATYCRRYAAAAILGIGQEDDDGEGIAGKNAADTKKSEPALPKWTEAQGKEFATLLGQIRGHFHVQNKFDEFEIFSDNAIASKGMNISPDRLLETLRAREKEFKDVADKFVASVSGEQPTLLES
jgi:hypothetical protein